MIQTILQLKAWFQKGCKPTAQQFADLFDSFRHRQEPIPQQDVAGLEETLKSKVDKSNIDYTVKNALNTIIINGVTLSETISVPAAYDATELVQQIGSDLYDVMREITMATFVIFRIPDMRLLVRTTGLNMTGLPDGHPDGMLYIRCLQELPSSPTYELSFYVYGDNVPYVCRYNDELTPWKQLATTDHTHLEYDQAITDASDALSRAEEVERQLGDKADISHSHPEYDQAVSDASDALFKAEEVERQLGDKADISHSHPEYDQAVSDASDALFRAEEVERQLGDKADVSHSHSEYDQAITDASYALARAEEAHTRIDNMDDIDPTILSDMQSEIERLSSAVEDGIKSINGVAPSETLGLYPAATDVTAVVKEAAVKSIAEMFTFETFNLSIVGFKADVRFAVCTDGLTLTDLPSGQSTGMLYFRCTQPKTEETPPTYEIHFVVPGTAPYICWYTDGAITPWTQLATADLLADLDTALTNLNAKLAAL
ncbi:MAG: hypothetical protein NC038_01185 [Paludibacter sp.]|nr:hypothetical protein [Bacteroidales bacterium]MCM1068822.1 hypothetical protein [Prevotella sp.]MCM1353083.1 hypothetical protein [Bacteroides sp.]MCM1442405.1 hypothetical protein [Muribaculum sp.]MCM1481248.1 hypothetical protein [Paludibacter sp.]